MGESLCVGDYISLYCENSHGYVFSCQSSSSNGGLNIYHNQKKRAPAGIPNPHAVTFQLQVEYRYKLNKCYRKCRDALNDNPRDVELQAAMVEAKEASIAEDEDNVQEQTRQRGKRLLYGQIIELRHVFTGKFVHVSTKQTSRKNKNNMMVSLLEHHSRQSQFRILPRYKVKSEGDLIQIEDQVILESVKSSGQFYHASIPFQVDEWTMGCELNLGVQPSGFTIRLNHRPNKGQDHFLKGGSVVRLFHKEIEAYLCAEGVFGEQVTENVHLRMRHVNPALQSTMLPSTSAITYWQIESEETILRGGVLEWGQQIRIRHMTTRQYLSVVGDGSVCLNPDPSDPMTVFRMHPVLKERDEIELESYTRIENVITKKWLHAQKDKEHVRRSAEMDGDSSFLGNIRWDGATLRKLSSEPEAMYHDAFTIQEVSNELVGDFNFAAGMVPVVHNLLAKKWAGEVLDHRTSELVHKPLRELTNFMVVNGIPNRSRQKLLRNLKLVDLLVDVLKLPVTEDSSDALHLQRIFRAAYTVLNNFLLGNSRKNERYFARYIAFFQGQFEADSEIGLNAVQMIMELIRDNRQIVDQITTTQIDQFVDLLRKNKNHRYLDLLNVLCVCDGVAIPDNQTYITEAWLCRNKEAVFLTQLGDRVDQQSDKVYMSTDGGQDWVCLDDFVATLEDSSEGVSIYSADVKAKEKEIEKLRFLEGQLDLFGKLCKGRNSFAIDVITNQLNYLTWEEAFLCLKNNSLPDDIRAKYCQLIVGLFVDVGDNHSVVENTKLTFIYNDISNHEKKSNGFNQMFAAIHKDAAQESNIIKDLRGWIALFLEANKDMTASMVEHNKLVEQVLRLVYFLVKFGFYGDAEDVRVLLTPLLNLIDGRNDKAYPIRAGSTRRQTRRHTKNMMKEFHKTRFEKSQETKALIEAKMQGLAVLEIILTFQFNIRLERFITIFKSADLNLGSEHHSDLAPLLYTTYSQQDDDISTRKAVAVLEEMFGITSYVNRNQLTDILLDLLNYDYKEMVTKSLWILHKLYSTHYQLFNKAVQAQVICTPESENVFDKVVLKMPILRRLSKSKLTEDLSNTMISILDEFIEFCCLPDEPDERHAMNQTILVNQGILPIMFDILSREVNTTLSQYGNLKSAFCKLLQLLKNLTRGNKDVQEKVFSHLDALLMVQGTECDLAEALTQVFIGNQQTCMKISSKQIMKIVKLTVERKRNVPQFLDLLCAVVKVEEIDLPLKKNQTFVMKYLMQNYEKVAFVVEYPQERREKILLGDEGPDQLSYLISLVDLLATCAEGENRLIESIGQGMFSLEELLHVIGHEGITNNLKRPYLRFLLWVYTNTGVSITEGAVADLQYSRPLWKYFESLTREIGKITSYVSAHKEVATKLLKKPPAKSATDRTEEGLSYGTLHYLFEAVFPFLQVFFDKLWTLDSEKYPDKQKTLTEMAENLLIFCDLIGPLLCSANQMGSMISAMSAILPATSLATTIMESFVEKHASSHLNRPSIISSASQQYLKNHTNEQELNAKLNTFAKNFKAAYCGPNLVSFQLGIRSDRAYVDGEDTQLPLGEEFQEHVKVFINASAKSKEEKYKLVPKIMQQLDPTSSRTKDTRERLEQAEHDVKCLQLVRAMIHNEERKLPQNWQENVKECACQLKVIAETQSALNNGDAVVSILPSIANQSDDVTREVMAVISAMLFNANRNVQLSIERYFLGTREEDFFFAVKNRMKVSAIAIKERRSLELQFAARQKTALQHLHLRHSLNFSDSEYLDWELTKVSNGFHTAANGQKQPHNGVKVPTKTTPGEEENTLLRANVADEDLSKITVKIDDNRSYAHARRSESKLGNFSYRDDGHIELVLDVLAKICDGQSKTFQDYLRFQPDNIKSVNLVAETAQFLGLVYSTLNVESIDLVIQLYETLNEFTTGNQLNRVVIFDQKVIDFTNFIIRMSKFRDCPREKVLKLYDSVFKLVLSLIEENDPAAKRLAIEISDTIDKDAIVKIMTDLYDESLLIPKTDRLTADRHQEIAFSCYHILVRIFNVSDAVEGDFIKAPKHLLAWNAFKKESMSIEILKDGHIQSVNFRVRNKELLRDDIKERMKWEVDRSSPSNKLRDLMAWSKDIIADIRYQKRLLSNRILKVVVQNWSTWGYICILLSLLINVFMLASWEAPLSRNDVNGSDLPPEIYDPVPVPTFSEYPYIMWTLSLVHNLFTILVVSVYFVSYNPKIPTVSGVKRWFRDLLGLEVKTDDDDTPEDSILDVQLLSFRTLYYLIFATMSGLGTALQGYFFAFHLLHIVRVNQLLKRVIKAVTMNGKSLIWVGILGVFIFYIYALISFAFLRNAMPPEDGYYCVTLWQCTVSVIRYGLIGELFETMKLDGPDATFDKFGMLVLFHITFFIFITTIGLNIIFGIIVDTFSELRDLKWQTESDMRDSCFICSRGSYDFEHYGKGFDHHVKEEHNMWAYIYFFIHLDEKPMTSHNALELAVSKMIKDKRTDFFPLNMALCLCGKEETSSESKIDALLSHVVGITKKQQLEEMEKHREQERLKQQKWEKEHRE